VASTTGTNTQEVGGAAKAVLLTMAAAQFVMILDASVMNVSIATVAKDVGTTVTGIQTAITAYTLVMAALMITGGKIGESGLPTTGVECSLVQTVEIGDHSIFVGEVKDAGVAVPPAGRPDDAILAMRDLGDKVFYGG
jgi:hypothetical protein